MKTLTILFSLLIFMPCFSEENKTITIENTKITIPKNWTADQKVHSSNITYREPKTEKLFASELSMSITTTKKNTPPKSKIQSFKKIMKKLTKDFTVIKEEENKITYSFAFMDYNLTQQIIIVNTQIIAFTINSKAYEKRKSEIETIVKSVNIE